MFESPVDCNSSQTPVHDPAGVHLFESPVDCNSSQTGVLIYRALQEFESPVDCNSSQTVKYGAAIAVRLRAL